MERLGAWLKVAEQAYHSGHLTPESVFHHVVPTVLDSRGQKGARQNP